MASTALARGALLLVSGIVSVLAAQPLFAATQTLTLPQAVEVALLHNGDIRSFRDEKGLRDASKIRAGLLPNPSLEFEGVTGAVTGSSDENSLSFGISQEVLLGGKREKRLAVADQELQVYRWQLADRERLLREEVATAFYDTLLAGKRIELAEKAIELNRQLFAVAGERLAAGDIPELELNLVKVELARSESARNELAKDRLQSEARLWTLLGLSTENQPAIVADLESAVSITRPLTGLKQLAGANRPDLKALEAEKGRGESEILLAEAESVPNLTAGLFYSREERTDETGSGEEKLRDNLLGIRLSMPIPVFDRNQAGIEEAQARKSSSQSRLTAASRTVEREVETAHASFQNAATVIGLYKYGILPQLEENLQLTREAYRLGETGILTVIQEQKKFFEVSDGYLTALHDRLLALVKLEAAVATDFSGGVQ